MRPAIIAEIERVLKGRTTLAEREEIAECAIRIVKEKTDSDALATMDAVKKNITKSK